jgi:hypothetical protein
LDAGPDRRMGTLAVWVDHFTHTVCVGVWVGVCVGVCWQCVYVLAVCVGVCADSVCGCYARVCVRWQCVCVLCVSELV